jgi:hypothetical protein
MSSRKGGGQPCNQNAVKHGFYVKIFSQGERIRLGLNEDDLESEFKACRVFIFRMVSRLSNGALPPDGSGDMDDKLINSINSLMNAFTTMATLARTHQIVTGKYEPTETAILDALADINMQDGIS